MENITPENIITSLFELGFEEVDILLYTYTEEQLLREKGENFKIKNQEFSTEFLECLLEEEDSFIAKKGNLKQAHISTNPLLTEALRELDFKRIILKKIIELNESNLDKKDCFCKKEKEIIAEIFKLSSFQKEKVAETPKKR